MHFKVIGVVPDTEKVLIGFVDFSDQLLELFLAGVFAGFGGGGRGPIVFFEERGAEFLLGGGSFGSRGGGGAEAEEESEGREERAGEEVGYHDLNIIAWLIYLAGLNY